MFYISPPALILVASLAMPAPPADAPVLSSSVVAQCGENWGVATRTYDLNSATEAALAEYMVFEARGDGAPVFEPPVLVVVADDAGALTVYVKEKTGVVTYSIEAFRAKYADPCNLPGVSPRTSS
jgi:hypothetical protein